MIGDGNTAIRILAVVRRKVIGILNTDGDIQSPVINPRGELLTSLGLPGIAEVIRMGRSWITKASTGLAPVVVVTTSAHLSLFNGENPTSTVGYYIDEIGTILATSATAAIVLGLGWCLNKSNTTANPAGTLAINSLSGKVNYSGQGNAKEGVTITNDGWFFTDSIVCANTDNKFLTVRSQLTGIIVQPGQMFNVASIANSAGAAIAQPYIKWHEVDLGSINP
jgi:hypothetical protein